MGLVFLSEVWIPTCVHLSMDHNIPMIDYIAVGPGSVTLTEVSFTGQTNFSGLVHGPVVWSLISSQLTSGAVPTDINGLYILLTDSTVILDGFCSRCVCDVRGSTASSRMLHRYPLRHVLRSL